jgi:hypothetical protein
MTVSTEFSTTEQAYLGHDNPVSIIPYSNYSERTNWDMAATIDVIVSADLVSSVATGDDIVMKASVNPTIVFFNQVLIKKVLVWQIHMVVGMFTGIAAGEYKLRVIIEDAVNTNGIVIADDLLVTVVDVP